MQLNQYLEDVPSITHDRLLLTIRRTLKRRDRLFLVLHYVQKLSAEEVASVMECSVEEVLSSMHRSMELVSAEIKTQNAPKAHSGS